ncbi:MAG: type II toxin-antitoxin system RelE/ParE family toxin [Bryobacteraceae bacterium]|nr:type II toxin-antitoxin system RelE/ParE family toxin [Bryobacteraceae bacterium]
MKSARFVPAARREFLAEIVYYNQERAGLGARFTAAVEEAAARALAFPRAGSPAAANTRRVFLQGFPFSVVYREVTAGIVIFAVAHQSRRPGYWESRVQDR